MLKKSWGKLLRTLFGFANNRVPIACFVAYKQWVQWEQCMFKTHFTSLHLPYITWFICYQPHQYAYYSMTILHHNLTHFSNWIYLHINIPYDINIAPYMAYSQPHPTWSLNWILSCTLNFVHTHWLETQPKEDQLFIYLFNLFPFTFPPKPICATWGLLCWTWIEHGLSSVKQALQPTCH